MKIPLNKIKSYKWEKWLERPFYGFVLSLFKAGTDKKTYEKMGLKNVNLEMFLLSDGVWYQSKGVFDKMANDLERWLDEGHSVFEITSRLTRFHKEKKKRILWLVKNKKVKLEDKLREVYEILTIITGYIWLAHGLEHYYDKILKKEVPKYVKKDIDLFIGDASLPKKKNAHALLEEAVLRKEDPRKIAKKFGWVKIRDGFSEPFSITEIKKMKVKEIKHKKVNIPKPLKELFKEVQELVFFRTQRGDVFFELFYTARPILKEAAKKYKINFPDLKYYTIHSLIGGRPKMYKEKFTCIGYQGEIYFLNKPLFINKKEKEIQEIKGVIAQQGRIKGVVKIVKFVSELNKVKKGDILVTQMTFPSFIMAMRRAAAFVTDEGGITCHAAIVAREMEKPCIIGTKIATKVLHDGQLVEVDANKGVVRIIK